MVMENVHTGRLGYVWSSPAKLGRCTFRKPISTKHFRLLERVGLDHMAENGPTSSPAGNASASAFAARYSKTQNCFWSTSRPLRSIRRRRDRPSTD